MGFIIDKIYFNMDENIGKHNQEWYKNTYNALIEKARLRNLKKNNSDGIYLEIHHIIPKSIGGTNDEDNLVTLTFREHLVAHKLLVKIYPNQSGLRLAVYFMISVLKGGKREKLSYINSNGKLRYFTSRELEEYRKGIIQKNKETKTGTKASKETRELLSKIRKGKKRKDSTKEAISKGRVGIKFSEEHKKKLSEKAKRKHLSDESKKKISGDNSLRARKIRDPKGNVFTSARECAKFYDVDEDTITGKWVKDPTKKFEYIEPLFTGYKVQSPDGTIYNSLREAGKAVKRAKSTVKRWIEKFPELGWKYYEGEE